MPPTRIIKRRITPDEVKRFEFDSAEESKLNDVLLLCLEAVTAQLTTNHSLRLARIETTPGLIFRTQPKYTQDEELLDFKNCLNVLKAKNKQLADITTQLIKLLLSSLEPKLEDMVASLDISPLETVEVDVAYRWNNPSGGTGYHSSIGFWCGQWEFEQKLEVKRQSFNDVEMLKDHLRGTKRASPWISMTHIPGHMLEILKQEWDDNTRDQRFQVHIIDFQKLKLLNPHTKTTQNLTTGIKVEKYHYEKNPEGLKAISNHHWLAQQWIPACCILGSMTIEVFRKILSDNDIRYSKSIKLTGYENADYI